MAPGPPDGGGAGGPRSGGPDRGATIRSWAVDTGAGPAGPGGSAGGAGGVASADAGPDPVRAYVGLAFYVLSGGGAGHGVRPGGHAGVWGDGAVVRRRASIELWPVRDA